MLKYVISLLCVVSAGNIPSIAVAQNLSGGYSDCACVSPAPITANSTTVGAVTDASGDVLIDGISVDSNRIITSNSEVFVGEGNAAITVGPSCEVTIPGNTQVSISQPGGPGSDLCVRKIEQGVAQEGGGTANGAIIGTIVIAAGVVAVAFATGDDDTPARAPASP